MGVSFQKKPPHHGPPRHLSDVAMEDLLVKAARGNGSKVNAKEAAHIIAFAKRNGISQAERNFFSRLTRDEFVTTAAKRLFSAAASPRIG